MITSLTPVLGPSQQPLPRTASTIDQEGGGNVLGALLEALNAPECYRLIQRDGEIFIESTN